MNKKRTYKITKDSFLWLYINRDVMYGSFSVACEYNACDWCTYGKQAV